MATRSLEIWETEVEKDHASGKNRINLSLRLWSDRVPIAALIKISSFEIEHFHEIGNPITIHGRSTGSIARRHYASVANFATNDISQIDRWFETVSEEISKQKELMDCIDSKSIDAVVWIAFFGNGLQSNPSFNKCSLAKFIQRHIRILIENYTDIDDDGIPRKTWIS